MHAIPLAPASFQLEKLWANKVLKTSSRQQRLRLGLILSPAAAAPFHAVTFLTSVWLILTAVFIHIPSPNESKKQPGSHHQCEEIYICLRNGSLSNVSSSAFVKTFVLNLLLSDMGLSSCANSLQQIGHRGPWFSRGSRKRNHTHHWLGFTRVYWETFWNLVLPKRDLRACFLCWWFRNGGLRWRFALTEKTSSFYSLWCGDTESGFCLPAVWGSESPKPMSNQGGGWKHEKHLHDL